MFSSETRSELRTQFALALPVFLAQISQMSMGFVDTVMTGRVSPLDMASVALATSMWGPVILFGQGILMAATPAISQLRGARAGNSTGKTGGDEAHLIRQTLLLMVGITLPLMTVFWFLSQILTIMSVPADLEDITRRYMLAMVWGLPGYMLMIALRCCMDGFAFVRPAMMAGAVGLLVNIPFNYVFIFGKFGFPKLGGVGAGVASAITCWAMALVMIYFAFRRPEFRAALRPAAWTSPHWATIRRLVGIGLPGALALLFEVTMFNVVAILIAPLGSIMMAGHQVAMNFSALMFMFPLSLSIPATIRISYALGRNDPALIRRAARISLFTGIGLALFTASCTILFRHEIALLYNNDPQVLALGASLLVLAGSYQCADALQVIGVGILRGFNDTRAIFLITFISYWMIALPLGYVLGRTDLILPAMGPAGFWWAFVLGLSVAAVFLTVRHQRLVKIKRLEAK